MALPPKRDHAITLEAAEDMTRRYRENAGAGAQLFPGENRMRPRRAAFEARLRADVVQRLDRPAARGAILSREPLPGLRERHGAVRGVAVPSMAATVQLVPSSDVGDVATLAQPAKPAATAITSTSRSRGPARWRSACRWCGRARTRPA